jgi:hypothetical protein
LQNWCGADAGVPSHEGRHHGQQHKTAVAPIAEEEEEAMTETHLCGPCKFENLSCLVFLSRFFSPPLLIVHTHTHIDGWI